MLVNALLIDFDGTACETDVSEGLLDAFGDPSWPELDRAIARGEIGIREGIDRQAAMLRGTEEHMLAFALGRYRLAPTFPGFVRWARGLDLPIAVVSDGFGFYIEPMLRAEGLDGLEVVTNRFVESGPSLEHPFAHPVCVGCGTCKMNAALRFRERHGPIAFVGEGLSDRYGALYSDVVFAKDALVPLCQADGVPFLPWETFDDVRGALERLEELPRPVAPERCPGWRSTL